MKALSIYTSEDQNHFPLQTKEGMLGDRRNLESCTAHAQLSIPVVNASSQRREHLGRNSIPSISQYLSVAV